MRPVEGVLVTESSILDLITPRRFLRPQCGCEESLYFRALHKDFFEKLQASARDCEAHKDRADYWYQEAQKHKADADYLRKLHFGEKSERKTNELKTFSGELQDSSPKRHGAQRGHKGHGRKIPFDLPTEDQIHIIEAQERFCRQCGGAFEEMNMEKVSYEVDIEVRTVLVRHRRKKYRKTCRCPHRIVTASGPLRLFKKGLYSMGFWIQVLTDKYAYGMPLERQVVRMGTEGLEISSGVLAAGLLRLAPLLKPLYELMLQRLAFERLIHADETRWRNWASRY